MILAEIDHYRGAFAYFGRFAINRPRKLAEKRRSFQFYRNGFPGCAPPTYPWARDPASAASRLWQAARVALVLIEPGTPRGFSLIRTVRAGLLAAGAHMLAPCPAGTACPVADPDWCHFAARVERSSLHRRVKGGELGYEDEKFSYVALARQAVEPPASRIVRRPRQQPGLIVLETCTPDGLQTVRVSKRDSERFRAARHAAWGDAGIS